MEETNNEKECRGSWHGRCAGTFPDDWPHGKQQDDNSENSSSGTTVTAPAADYTGGPTWGKPTSKMSVNFEGRVASVEYGKVTLEDSTVVLTDDAEISVPDGSAAEISVGDYIQGNAEDIDAAELNASFILITAL